jgi:ApaG protein
MMDTSKIVERQRNEIHIAVQVRFVPEQSDPGKPLYLYAYTITITNRGTIPCRLLSRHWIITDGMGRVEEVRGAGVVGEQPHLRPGQGFQYTSACPLRTPSGSMRGSYQMVNDEGERFDAPIAPFALFQSSQLN